MTNRERAIVCANETDRLIIETVESGKSFRVEAGAGAGKTYSLLRVIEWLDHERKNSYTITGQHIACITYTNAAVDVIKSRLATDSFIRPSTIHTFAWELIKQFQSSLIAAVEELRLLPKKEENPSELISASDVKHITYSLGVRYVENGTLYLYHDDVIKLFSKLMDNRKFRSVLARKFPVILIDEYQDSFRLVMDQFIKYFIEKETGPQFGLFGDAWQTIYGSQGACGLVESEKLVVINKEANFRSQEVIVNALNQIRPSLPQISASDDTDGEIIIITTNEFSSCRISKGYYQGELKDDVLKTCITKCTEKLAELKWDGTTKKLMLTHKLLAKQQGYSQILDVLEEHLKNRDDEHFLFFQNKVEPIYFALETNDSKKLFEALGVERRPIESRQNKRQWRELRSKLQEARQGVVFDVLKVIKESKLVGIPPKIEYWMEEYMNSNQERLYHGKPIASLYNVDYSEVIKAIGFFQPDAEFSTDHGVKGEQYDNVFLVMGRGWNEYKFDETLFLNENQLADNQLKTFIRTRNLFYVCCSRPKKRLAILITVEVNNQFRAYLCRVFGAEAIAEYSEFLKMGR